MQGCTRHMMHGHHMHTRCTDVWARPGREHANTKTAVWRRICTQVLGHLAGWKSTVGMPTRSLSFAVPVVFLPAGPYLPVRCMLRTVLIRGGKVSVRGGLDSPGRVPPQFPTSA